MKLPIKRINIIGSEWVFFKIYTGTKTSENLLIDTIKPISEELINNRIIDKWFFIRYEDPKNHLRIRFHVTDVKYIGTVISNLYILLEEYIQKDLVWKVQIDTYFRELERYGHNNIISSESFFYYDSEMIIKILNTINNEEDRWLFSLKIIDDHLDMFGYDIIDKQKLLENMSVSFKSEFEMSKYVNKAVNDKYRKYKNEINLMINNQHDNKEVYDIIEERRKKVKTIIIDILKFIHDDRMSLDELNVSYIHMTFNRLFKSQNRAHEAICYDFINRYYKSKIAINNLQNKL